ncbi:hypothetical protein [Georgenia halophila]|uniref:hypothetical protein n=1 Tax=Georgenia halophila TaxID=620889 RepID=UPI0031E501EC
MYEPQLAVETLERSLRQLMAHAYAAEYGRGNWIDEIITSDQRSKWASLRTADQQQRTGVILPGGHGLEFTELTELVEIARQHWAPLKDALGKKKSAEPYLQTFLPLAERATRRRNAANHNRPLAPFEQELLSGIAGLIRNQVTIAMSSADPAGDIYPRIEAARDSFRHEMEIVRPDGELAGHIDTGAILHPGERVTFTCVAHDPDGRRLTWSARSNHDLQGGTSDTVESGEPVQLTWVVADSDVRESSTVSLFMTTEDSRYHRCGSFDQRIYFRYAVRPLAT